LRRDSRNLVPDTPVRSRRYRPSRTGHHAAAGSPISSALRPGHHLAKIARCAAPRPAVARGGATSSPMGESRSLMPSVADVHRRPRHVPAKTSKAETTRWTPATNCFHLVLSPVYAGHRVRPATLPARAVLRGASPTTQSRSSSGRLIVTCRSPVRTELRRRVLKPPPARRRFVTFRATSCPLATARSPRRPPRVRSVSGSLAAGSCRPARSAVEYRS